MAGNVWQWCGGWYGDYSSTAVTNPTGSATRDVSVLRGGSWEYDIDYGRGAGRGNYYPANYYYGIGYRCASSSPGP